MKNVTTLLLVLLLASCANKFALKPTDSVDKAETLAEVKNTATAVHLTKCTWPGPVEEDTLEEYLFSFETIINEHFKPCYLRHNDWVDTHTGDKDDE